MALFLYLVHPLTLIPGLSAGSIKLSLKKSLKIYLYIHLYRCQSRNKGQEYFWKVKKSLFHFYNYFWKLKKSLFHFLRKSDKVIKSIYVEPTFKILIAFLLFSCTNYYRQSFRVYWANKFAQDQR